MEDLKLVIKGEEGEEYVFIERAVLAVRDPESELEREFFAFEDENGEIMYMEIMDETTLQEVTDPELLEALQSVDL